MKIGEMNNEAVTEVQFHVAPKTHYVLKSVILKIWKNISGLNNLIIIPDYLDNKNKVFNKMISRLHENLQSGSPFSITKDDTIFIFKEP